MTGHQLTSRLSGRFNDEIKRRGEEYFQRGAVRIAEAGPTRVFATVEGTNRYTVELRFREEKVQMSCSCPYFLDYDAPCKHLWAVILALEAKAKRSEEDEKELPDRRVSEAPNDPVAPAANQSGAQALRPGRFGLRFAGGHQPPPIQVPEWKRSLEGIRRAVPRPVLAGGRGSNRNRTRELFYVVDTREAPQTGGVVVHLYDRPAGAESRPTAVDHRGIPVSAISTSSEEEEEILAILSATAPWDRFGFFDYYRFRNGTERLPASVALGDNLAELLLPKMCRIGRCLLLVSGPAPTVTETALDEGQPWQFQLVITEVGQSREREIRAQFVRDQKVIDVSEADLVTREGFFFADGLLSRYLENAGIWAWIELLRDEAPPRVPETDFAELIREMVSLPELPPLTMVGGSPVEVVRCEPQKRLAVRTAAEAGYSNTGGRLVGELSLDYDGTVVSDEDPPSGLYLEEERRLVLRDHACERGARERLIGLGFREVHDSQARRQVLKMAGRRLPEVVRTLLAEGWRVEAEDKLYRQAGRIDIRFTSGIDWFEVHGGIDFDGQSVALPELLKALKRGRNMVRLGDGSFGILPEEWLDRAGVALALGEAAADGLRYRASQALLIDLLFGDNDHIWHDEAFESLRADIGRFEGVQPEEAPPGFVGTLRGYQREGLGWFRFLDRFGFGGCLADDMGLGKTVQVLALLEARREERRTQPAEPESRRSLLDGRELGGEASHPAPSSNTPSAGLSESNVPASGGEVAGGAPSLVVVPKSLIFNWKSEAARFAPLLRILEHTGSDRHARIEPVHSYDVVLTTYGTLRRDVVWLKGITFDYVILDEAQAIKNPHSATAKSARLLTARRRLALSGTPVENHLSELWSLIEFLNPGMLGGVQVFSRHFALGGELDEAKRTALSRALRPFILRRTKRQVAPELPEKIEQTLYCELSPAERRRYDELAEHYRALLTEKIASDGFKRSKIHVLEALLRLRQAACDPGLFDGGKRWRPGAKVEMLLEQLEDVIAEGRKALVFSQFTSFLAIVRERLEATGIRYEYLDGATHDREVRVQRFQEDPACPIFLISLKAGGLGLNLTAAEYVFILDPWWNPAVEAQAVDRTHRIGQERTVFAYRLIARNTVEERVLALQDSKRALADAIITEDNRLIGELTQEDLALLLS